MARIAAAKADLLPLLGECFREHGYEGASLARITAATGLGKGSLYHFFPDGKEQMLTEVLSEIDGWFERCVFAPLRSASPARAGILETLDAVEGYFQSGRRVCLVGALALSDTRDRFAEPIRSYFDRWIAALAGALTREGRPTPGQEAEEIVASIQGAILLSRALDNTAVFARSMALLRGRFTD